MITTIESPRKEILQLVEQMQRSWNEHDAKGYAEGFAEDAEFTTVFGNVNRGREAIEEGHVVVFARLFKSSRVTVMGTSVRLIKADVASVHIRWSMSGAMQPDGTPWKERKGILTWIVVDHSHRWEIVEALNSESIDPLPGLISMLENKS